MAARGSSHSAMTRRQYNNRNVRNARGEYISGNAVRKLQEVPERRRPPQRRKQEDGSRLPGKAAKPGQLSEEVIRNREKAAGINMSFIFFLTAICVGVLAFSVYYLRLKSDITATMNSVARLESEWNQIKEENDAYYSQVTNDIDISRIKKIAIGRLEMNYPNESQMETYQTARSSYVRQHQQIPDIK